MHGSKLCLFCSKGMHFENVSILINAVADVLKDMGYCWRDKQGHICSQNGIFRVNCIDCLDRTNVVQVSYSLFKTNFMLAIYSKL